MDPARTVDLLDSILDPLTQTMTVDLAQRIASLRADPATQAHIDALADRNSAGTLTADEREEYETLVNALGLVSILQAKARTFLSRNHAA